MKNYISIITLFFSIILFPSSCFAKWNSIANANGNKFYVDTDRIRFNNDNVFWWSLVNLFEPFKKSFSILSYREGDCNTYKFRGLTISSYSKAWGKGKLITDGNKTTQWKFAKPGTIDEIMLDTVCIEKK
jgi:hypothetical protein